VNDPAAASLAAERDALAAQLEALSTQLETATADKEALMNKAEATAAARDEVAKQVCLQARHSYCAVILATWLACRCSIAALPRKCLTVRNKRGLRFLLLACIELPKRTAAPACC
jgi:hypothetical protein